MSISSTTSKSTSTSTSTTGFLNYGKLLENSTQLPKQHFIDNNKKNNENEWVVTEKVHGANFSFHVERTNNNNNNNDDDDDNDSQKEEEKDGGLWVRVAKRRGFLSSSDDDNNFFGHHIVVQNLRNTILQAAKQEFFDNNNDDDDHAQDNNEKNPKIRLVVFFGELFGGYYPNNGSTDDDDDDDDDDNNKMKSKSDAVQQGIWYSQKKHFYLFDIAVMYESSGTSFFIPYKRTVEIATKHKLLYAKPLYIGPFNKAIHYNPKFITTIPNQLLAVGNTNITIKDNFAEGIVVKQWNSVDPIIMINEKNDTTTNNNKTSSSSSTTRQKQQQQQRRPIYKIKIKEFQELPSSSRPAKKHNDYEYRKWIISLININRIAAAISKVGNPCVIENQNEIINLILQDLIEESGDNNLIMVEMKEQLECIAYDELRKYVYQCYNTTT